MVRRRIATKKNSVTLIQARVRGFLQRRALQIQQRSALLLQRYFRQWVLQRRVVICSPQWIYYNPLSSVDGVSDYDDKIISATVNLDSTEFEADQLQFDVFDWEPGGQNMLIYATLSQPCIEMVLSQSGLESGAPHLVLMIILSVN